MNEQHFNSTKKLDLAKDRLRDAITRLESAIESQNNKLSGEKNLRVMVIEDLNAHIANIETILNNQ